MKSLSLILSVIAVTFASLAFSVDITWVEKAQNPAYFPYKAGSASNLEMDLPIPVATNRSFEICSAYQATDYFYTNLPMWSESDAMYGVEGYWPCYRAIGIFANGNYYIGGGSGPNNNLAGIKGNFRGAGYDADQLGYLWPSNSTGGGFSYNRQAGFAIYDLSEDAWDAAKWDQTGPVGYNIPTAGTSWPVRDMGTQITPNQAFAFDVDEDGTEEIFLHGGYPHWGGYCAVYDPDENEGKGSWSTTSDAVNFSSGLKAQYGGGAVRISSNIWCIGGVYWGPDVGTHMQRYSVPDDSWVKYENVHPQKLDSFGVAAVNTKIYMLGGYVGRVGRTSPGAATNAVFMLDTTNIAAGVSIVGRLAVAVSDPAVISWKGVLYLVGGEIEDGNYTNLFQIFNPLTGATVIHDARLPVNAASPSCAVTPDGQFLFGGAMRTQTEEGFFNSSRLWTAPLPEQDLFVAPTILDYWQTNDTLQIRLDNVTGLGIVCTVATENAWLDIPNGIVTVGAASTYVDVTINRTTLSGPTNGLVTVNWGSGNVNVQVSADTPRPIGQLVPDNDITLQPKTKQYTIHNNGSVAMNFTNATTDAFIANITPLTGTIPPLSSTVVNFDVTAAALRPSSGTIGVTYNSFDGEVLTFTIHNYPSDYYVATDGDNGNTGLSMTSAWATIAYGINNVPNGSEEEGAITLNIGPGTYAGECTDATGTNWFLDLTGKSYVNIIGAGPEQTILTKGSATWQLTPNNDTIPDMPVVKIDNANNLRFSGMTIMANEPPAVTDGLGYPEHCAVIGLFNCESIQLDNLYLDGTYAGMVYNTYTAAWQTSWVGWWYHAIVVNGLIGPGNVSIDHVLSRGFERAVYNNNFALGGNDQNVNFVTIDHCTFVENICPSDAVHAVNIRVASAEYGPSFVVHNSIIADIPWSGYANAQFAEGLSAAAISSLNNFDFTMLSQSNQFYSVGLPVPGVDYVNINVVQEDEIIGLPFTDYTNEPPVFIVASGLPYSTDIETDAGYRDVGWNPVPEPACALAMLVLAAISIKRFMK